MSVQFRVHYSEMKRQLVARELVKQQQLQAKDAILIYYVLRMHSFVAAYSYD